MAVAVLESPLLAVLDGLAEVDPASLGEAFLAERAAELLQATDRVASLLAHTVAEAQTRGLGVNGYTTDWVQRNASSQLGRSTRATMVVRAQTVAGLPLVAALHAGAEVSTAFLDAAGAGLRKLPKEAHATWDAMLAGEARDLDPADIGKLLAQFRVLIDPDTANAEADERAQRSSLHVSPFGSDGAWAINGTLYGVEAELLARMLNHYGKPRDADDRRSKGERNASALVQILRVAERASTDHDFIPAPRGAAGHIVVHVKAETWGGEPGAPAATTESGTVVDPGQFEAMRCATAPEAMLYDTTDTAGAAGPESEAEHDARLVSGILAGMLGPELGVRIEPLAYARGARTASRQQFSALVARDHHCVVGHCTRGPDWSEAHHLREWVADYGLTDLNNLALVCWEHHTWLHRMGYHLHPPWCRCEHCGTDEWSLHSEPPTP